jgi:hypothetical protein
VSWPPSVVPAPNGIGFGVAASVTPSGCGLVLNDLSPPSVWPCALRAINR